MTSESAGTSDDGPNIEASERMETGGVSRWGPTNAGAAACDERFRFAEGGPKQEL